VARRNANHAITAAPESTLPASAPAQAEVGLRLVLDAGRAAALRGRAERQIADQLAVRALDRLAERVRALPALRGILGERLGDQRVDARIDLDVGRARARRLDLGGQVLGEHADRVLGGEHLRAGEHVVHERAHRIEIAARVDLVAADLLRRHEVRRADDLGALGDRGRRLILLWRAELGEAEVEHLREVAAVGRARDQHVLRLEIAVHDAEVVRFGERAADLVEQRRRARPRQRAVAAHDLAEILAAHVLHDQVQRALRLPEVEDLHRVRVVEARHRVRLALEAADHFRIVGEIGVQDLHRRDLAHALVLDLVDDAHAAAADQIRDLVAAVDDLAHPRAVRRGDAAIEVRRRLVGPRGIAAARPRLLDLVDLGRVDALARRGLRERRRALEIGAALAAVARRQLRRRVAARADDLARGRRHDSTGA
jgi:hypothetical protein